MFGMSIFQSVLERLKAEESRPQDGSPRDDAGGERFGTPMPGFVSATSPAHPADARAVHRAYLDMAGQDMLAPAKPAAPPVLPDHLRRIRPADILLDLGLAKGETPAGLADKRRRFAADNHPDRHHPDFRAHATVRMKIANMLIDEAIKRCR